MSNTEDEPVRCPVCGAEFEGVSIHDEGLVVQLRDSDQFDRLCFQPVEGEHRPLLRFFQHTAAQAGTGEPGSAGGRIP